MERHEIKARVDAQMSEWKNNLDVMKAKADAKTGDTNAKYREGVADLQSQYDDLKISAAKAWDVADDKAGEASDAVELKWAEWQVRANQAWEDISKN
jgi:hypothetical protein